MVKDTPAGFAVRTIRVIKYKLAEKKLSSDFSSLVTFQRRDNCNIKEIYVLLIGESSRYDHWSINGYKRNTSPKIISLNNFVSFSNVISPWYLTQQAVPLLFSLTPSGTSTSISPPPGLIDYFKAAGFTTYWLSNQSNQGNKLAAVAESADYFFEPIQPQKQAYDEILLVKLKEVLQKNESKVFVVLHTIGSHYPYHYRYPPSFAIFTPDSRINHHLRVSDKEKLKTINSYDNTIVYSDFIIDSVIRLINTDN
jgi:glucan phosphoethanolaminetransferase (alkaline phosphatase superfamily)